MPAYLPLAQQRIKTSSDIRAQEHCSTTIIIPCQRQL
jgi:hypothetical protein